MHFRTFSIKWIGVLLLAGVVLTGCNPKKKVQKYAYLNKKTPRTTTTTPVKKEPVISVPEDDVTAGTPAKNVHKVLKEAESYLGTPYKYGAANKSGTDCSGLTQNAWAAVGVKIPRSSRDQSQHGKKVSKKEISPGDLVFFSAYKNGKIDHVGLVSEVSGNEITFIHATVSKGVMRNRLDVGYWSERFMSARRVY